MLNTTLAISLRCDRMQVDKMYVLDKIINNEGNKELLFLGAEGPKERGVKGMIQGKGSFK